jgi:transcriptional regulator with XRE-family HTH domain
MGWEERIPLRDALREFRQDRHLTQDEMAESLGISRKTYLLFETCRWLPPARERGHFVKVLHGHDPALAKLLAGFLDQKVEEVALSADAPKLDATEAKRVFDIAVYETAEELDMNPRALRPIVAGVIERLAASGITLSQAAALAKATRALSAKKSPA